MTYRPFTVKDQYDLTQDRTPNNTHAQVVLFYSIDSTITYRVGEFGWANIRTGGSREVDP